MKVYKCPKCKKVIGRVELVGGLEFLRIGNLFYTRELRSYCTTCGCEINYSMSDAFIRKLVERVNDDDVQVDVL